MLIRVTCAGVVIGTAQFDPPSGLAHAALAPTTEYAIACAAARTLGQHLAGRRLWCRPEDGDFADAIAASWRGGRLALEDLTGRELCVANVAVIEGDPMKLGGTHVRVVADFRSDLARVASRIRPIGNDGESRTRPAA